MYNRSVHDLSIRLFGSPRVRRGSQEVLIQRRKDLALLIYLIVTSQPHRRDTLATLLWGDQNQAEARSSLRKSLSRLKSILGENVLITRQDQVSLNPEHPVDVDVAQFNLRVRQFHEHRHAPSGLCDGCQKALEEAARYYQADFLAGFSLSDSPVFEEWQFFQSEGFRKNLAEILEQLARLCAEREDYNAAIEYGRRWLALDRLNETAHRQLISLYALSGQRAAAKRQFEECRRILKEELNAEPEEETLQLLRGLQKKRPLAGTSAVEAVQPITPSRKPHHFPVHPAPFIGREKELGEIIRILRESPYRLLSLLGPGGSGKTRLALQVGTTLDQDAGKPFGDEIWFVPLAPLTQSEFILDAIAESLGLAGQVRGADVRDAFLSEIRGREMLLILDNFEHLLSEGSIRLMHEILNAAPRSKILITSRERLNMEGEYLFPVEGLDTPSDEPLHVHSQLHTDLLSSRYSALKLFEQSAIRLDPSFKITEANFNAIVRICQLAQGMPLAIELAASWLEVLSPQEIYNELTRSLDFLASNWRDLPDRQRSLRAVFDSSWQMLDRKARTIVKALSVFRSSFIREAAQAVAGASAKALLELTNKSWVHRLPDGRYQIHELLRQFAFEKLESETATSGLVMEQYSSYYAAYAARLWEEMKGANQQRAFSGVEAEFENIQVAWSWLVSAGKLETAVKSILPVLFHYAELRRKADTLIRMLDLGLTSLPPGGSRQDAQSHHQEIILRSARGAFFPDGFPVRYNIPPDVIFLAGSEAIHRAWTLAQKEGAFQKLGFWGILLSYLYGRMIHYNEGVRQLERMLPFFEGTGQTWELAIVYLHLLKLLIPNEQHGSRRGKQLAGYVSRARDLFTSLGDAVNLGHIMILGGDLKYQQQDVEGAIQQWQLAHNSFLKTGEWALVIHTLWQLSDANVQVGEFKKAFEGYREVAEIYRERGNSSQQVSALSKESYLKARHGEIEEALQIRRTCMEITLEIGNTHQCAWDYWEMGELLRVRGDAEAAAEWYVRAAPIFEKEQDHLGRSYSFRALGDLALGKEDYRSARGHFSTCVELAKSVNHTWMICYALSKLARAQVELQDVRSARRNLRSAFQYGMKTLDQGIMLVAVVEYAEFCRKLGRNERAAELGSLVNDHFASWHETRAHASRLLDSLRRQMPAGKYAQYRKKGRNLDLWTSVKSSIDELGAKRSLSSPNETRGRKRAPAV